MNQKLQSVCDHITSEIPGLFAEAEEHMQEAIECAVRVSQFGDEPKPAKLTIPISVAWNLDTNKIEVSVAVNVKHKYTSEATLPDPNQPSLPGAENSK